jgi:hypothetical protein
VPKAGTKLKNTAKIKKPQKHENLMKMDLKAKNSNQQNLNEFSDEQDQKTRIQRIQNKTKHPNSAHPVHKVITVLTKIIFPL